MLGLDVICGVDEKRHMLVDCVQRGEEFARTGTVTLGADARTCPACSQPATSWCKCALGDARCASGHEWHTCPVHKVIVRGASDHAHADKCSCPTETTVGAGDGDSGGSRAFQIGAVAVLIGLLGYVLWRNDGPEGRPNQRWGEPWDHYMMRYSRWRDARNVQVRARFAPFIAASTKRREAQRALAIAEKRYLPARRASRSGKRA